MTWVIKLSFLLIMDWFCNMTKMRRTWCDFVIAWNWPRTLICLSYYEHM